MMFGFYCEQLNNRAFENLVTLNLVSHVSLQLAIYSANLGAQVNDKRVFPTLLRSLSLANTPLSLLAPKTDIYPPAAGSESPVRLRTTNSGIYSPNIPTAGASYSFTTFNPSLFSFVVRFLSFTVRQNLTVCLYGGVFSLIWDFVAMNLFSRTYKI